MYVTESTRKKSPVPETANIAVQDTPAGPVGAAPEDAVMDGVVRLKLDKFEGPFEVLLYLIRTQEIDIFDIPILKVTEQYLQFLEMMREENLDIAGEFLVMAATLIQIKSRMILPVQTGEDEEEEIEEEDPRLELVEMLLQYRKFRDLAQRLGELEEARSNCFARRVRPALEVDKDEEEYLEVSLYDLMKAIRVILRFLMEAPVHHVAGEVASVDEVIDRIIQILAEQESVCWTDLYRACRSKTEIVCCLLAILELCRMERIRAHQHCSFGEIRIFAQTPAQEPAAVLGETGDDVVAT